MTNMYISIYGCKTNNYLIFNSDITWRLRISKNKSKLKRRTSSSILIFSVVVLFSVFPCFSPLLTQRDCWICHSLFLGEAVWIPFGLDHQLTTPFVSKERAQSLLLPREHRNLQLPHKSMFWVLLSHLQIRRWYLYWHMRFLIIIEHSFISRFDNCSR